MFEPHTGDITANMRQVGLVEADRMYGAKRQIVESLGFATVQVRGCIAH